MSCVPETPEHELMTASQERAVDEALLGRKEQDINCEAIPHTAPEGTCIEPNPHLPPGEASTIVVVQTHESATGAEDQVEISATQWQQRTSLSSTGPFETEPSVT